MNNESQIQKTIEEKKMWLDKAKDFAGNQVKIVEVWN